MQNKEFDEIITITKLETIGFDWTYLIVHHFQNEQFACFV